MLTILAIWNSLAHREWLQLDAGLRELGVRGDCTTAKIAYAPQAPWQPGKLLHRLDHPKSKQCLTVILPATLIMRVCVGAA